MHPKKNFGVEDLEQIKLSYLSGTALWKIGEEFSVSRTVILRVVKELGIFKENRTKLSIEEYKERLKKFGRVELVGEWVDTATKTLHFCLEHKESHLAYPGNVLKGLGLACCLREGAKMHNRELINNAFSVYDEKISIITNNKIVRIGDYSGNKVHIEHLCLIHNETHLARPDNVLSGFGLSCCGRVVWEGLGHDRNMRAKNKYDNFLADRSDGRFSRLGEYMDATTPTLHYCSIHREEHLAIPNSLLNGNGMPCCNSGTGWDTLENLLENKKLCLDTSVTDPCQFYIYQVPNTVDCVKVGIAKSSHRRSQKGVSKDLYGELVSIWQCSTRRNAILLETAVLRDPSFEHPEEFLETLEFKAGQSEVRRVDIHSLVDHVQILFDSLERAGFNWSFWALDRIPSLRKWEIKVLQDLIDS